MQATLTFLGTGTSMGVPTLGCSCDVCTSTDPRNNRMRSSAMVEFDGHSIVIDTGQDFRSQALRAGITHVDAVFYTHGHADHMLGFDDLRPLTFLKDKPTPLFADPDTAAAIRRVFAYTFRTENRYPTSARVELVETGTDLGSTVDTCGITVERVPVIHGREVVSGFRFSSMAYITDMSDIPEASMERLRGLDIVVLDALRREHHPSHSTLANSLRLAEILGAKRTYFTHISHDLDHKSISAALPENVYLAYDGLKLEFEIA